MIDYSFFKGNIGDFEYYISKNGIYDDGAFRDVDPVEGSTTLQYPIKQGDFLYLRHKSMKFFRVLPFYGRCTIGTKFYHLSDNGKMSIL